MISNQQFWDTFRNIPTEMRERLVRLKLPRAMRGSEKEIIRGMMPSNPVRVVELAAEQARMKHGWAEVYWAIDNESCWVSNDQIPQKDSVSYYVPIRKDEDKDSAERIAVLTLLAKVEAK
jgi:hypothetical protein